MCEIVKDSDYYAIQHFISESPWDHQSVMDTAAAQAGKSLQSTGKKIALLVDESGHAKKGTKSVGVSRQYSGTLGKVDNCQVGVYCTLSSDKYYSIVDAALFLPKDWTDDPKRCRKAGIPEENQTYKTKLELALEMIKHQQEQGVKFDYVGGDGLYGNNYALIAALDELNITAIFDVHSDQYIYTEAPHLYIPDARGKRGRAPTKVQTDSCAITVKAFYETLDSAAFQEVSIRKGTKGALKSHAYCQKVYTWDGHSATCHERLLLIRVSKTPEGNEEIKYASSNATEGDYTLEELVEMQAQRYYIERSFQDAKQSMGLSHYQVRGWKAWHHHMALCIMAQGYILEENLFWKEKVPLLNAADIRYVLAATLARKNDDYNIIEEQIKYRHRQRQLDMDRRYNT